MNNDIIGPRPHAKYTLFDMLGNKLNNVWHIRNSCTLLTGIHHKSFPLNSWWRFGCNILNNSVYTSNTVADLPCHIVKELVFKIIPAIHKIKRWTNKYIVKVGEGHKTDKITYTKENGLKLDIFYLHPKWESKKCRVKSNTIPSGYHHQRVYRTLTIWGVCVFSHVIVMLIVLLHIG